MKNKIPNSESTISNSEGGSEELKKTIFQYLKYWPWFTLSLIIALSSAFFYLRYSNNIYQTEAKIKILKEQSGLDLKGLQGSAPLIDMRSVNLDNEMSVLKSRRIAEKIVDTLELTSEYYRSGKIKFFEIWGSERPFILSLNNKEALNATPLYNVEFQSLFEFKITNLNNDYSKTYNVGDSIILGGNTLTLNLNPNFQGSFNEIMENSYNFKFNSKSQAISRLTSQIQMEPVGGKSEILNLLINGQSKAKNEDILNTLVNLYNSDGVEDNRQLAKRTEKFVIERLKFLVSELDTVESGLVNYKSNINILEVGQSATELFSKSSSTEGQIFEIKNQLSLTESFKQEILAQDKYELYPARIGITNDNINKFTEAYNDEILDRERLLISSTGENPKVKQLDNLLDQLRNNIINTINSYIQSLELSLRELENRNRKFDNSISELPQQEKEIRSIQRQQEVKQKLYLFLLQKREEAALSYAITAPIIKVVDYAYTKPSPISPKSNIIILSSILIGLVVPFGVFYLIFLLDTKVKSKDQIKAFLPNIPVVAEVPQFKNEKNKVILPSDRSSIAESFRIMRTNLNFMKVKKETDSSSNCKVVFVTSTTKGEGKTFVAVNLATSLTAAKKKSVLVGCDLRNPQIHTYLNLKKNHVGVTNYLYDDSVNIEKLVIKYPVENFELDVILSGEIPPNPAEMLMSSKFSQLIEELKHKYDYIIIDTAPTILVTDTILISNYADITLYITRSGYTDTRLFTHIRDVYQQKKLINMGIIINGLDDSGINAYNYGYGYGYGESNEKKKPWEFWK